MQKMCNHCGKEYNAPSNKSKYCSTKCYHDSTITRVKKTCPVCGKLFELVKSVAHRIYCSRECYNKDHACKYVTKICPECGKEFEVSKSTEHRYNFCSWECRTAKTVYRECARCGKVFRVQRDYNKYCSEECRRPPVIIKCLTCGVEFRNTPSETNRRFCSFSCYRKYTGESSLEAAFRECLESIGIEYKPEVQVGRYCIDFAINPKIALEVDGEYWHNEEHDRKKDKYLTKHGWNVIRFKEYEFLNSEDRCQLITSKINKLTQ